MVDVWSGIISHTRQLFVFAFQATEPEFLLLSHIVTWKTCKWRRKLTGNQTWNQMPKKNFTDFLSLRQNHVISGLWWRTRIKISRINFSDHFSFSCFFRKAGSWEWFHGAEDGNNGHMACPSVHNSEKWIPEARDQPG